MKNEISKEEEEDEPDKRDFAEVDINQVRVELLRNRDHLHKSN